MGTKSAPSAPPPPDPAATAAAQAAANREAVRESALVNQINQVTPFGNLTYTGEVGKPDRTATQTLSPAQQRMLDLSNRAGIAYGETANDQMSAIRSRLAQPVNFAALGAAPVPDAATRSSALAAMLARAEPQQGRDRAALETRLANQGLAIGSEPWRAEMERFDRGVNDFRLAADLQAGGEMARQYGLEAAARDRAINEMLQQRSVPLNELAAMLSGTQVQNPQYVNTGGYQVSAPDILGATYASANAQGTDAAARRQAAAVNAQGLYSLLGSGANAAALAWSDMRLKTDIRRICTAPNGIGIFVWRYVWDAIERIGLVAQGVARIVPAAVTDVGGFLAVDYRRALGAEPLLILDWVAGAWRPRKGDGSLWRTD